MNPEKAKGASLQRRSPTCILRLLRTPNDQVLPGFHPWPGALPLAPPDPAGLDPGAPTLPSTHRSQMRRDLRSPRLTVGASAAFAETLPGRERERERERERGGEGGATLT
jgi:hypothetical protein